MYEKILKIKYDIVPINIEIKINSLDKDIVFIETFDLFKENTYFTKIKLPLNEGENLFKIKLPIHSRVFCLSIKTNKDIIKDVSYRIYEVKVDENLFLNNKLKEFISFAKIIAENKNILPEGKYYSEYGNFRIDIVKNIPFSTSPARINCKTKVIDLSKQFTYDLTVQQVFVILLHEYSHCFINKNPNDEIEADYHAIRHYLKLNFSENELQKGYSKMFINKPTSLNKKRYDFIKNFIYKHI